MTTNTETTQRLERIESAIAHLQHDVDGLHSSLLLQLRRLQDMDARFVRLEQELETPPTSQPKLDAAAERPPHY